VAVNEEKLSIVRYFVEKTTGHGGRANSTGIETPIFNDQSNVSIPQTKVKFKKCYWGEVGQIA